MSNKKLVVGNWKMNPSSLDEAKRISRKVRTVSSQLKNVDAAVCPPFVFINAATSKKGSPHYHIGAQTVSFEDGGPHTGEVGASMLKDIGVEYVIAGHSEMRAAGESENSIKMRIKAILDNSMVPIVCVGEKNRDENAEYFEFIKNQLKNTLSEISKSECGRIIVAYEPVWAIGASEAMKPEDIHEMVIFIKKVFADIFGPDMARKVRVLYGGAVTSRNASDIMKVGQVDGLLVGRESVNAAGFVELLKIVDQI